MDPLPAISVDSARTADDAVWRDWLRAATTPGWGAVVALMIVGAVLRFIRLDQPPLLFDEAAVYTRVTGTYRELLNILRDDGFAPLHYELYWVLSRFIRLTPMVMRLIPALSGIAMIPAMYFLARQITSKKVATLAAAIATFSAYLLVYARDAKMYMPLWLFATLFMASLLWWLRATDPRLRRIAWFAWVAFGCAMNGFHALGLCLAPVAIVVALLHPRLTARNVLLSVAGLLITVSGLAGYYGFFNRSAQRVQADSMRTAGLEWIGQRNRQFSKPFLVWDVAASWVLAYRSPRPPVTPPTRVITPVVIVSAVLALLLIAGAFPWPKNLRDDDADDIPTDARGWRGPAWLGAWILLPCVGFAVVSWGPRPHDVWNARYLAMIWPALCVGMAWLIQRLPREELRAGAIVVLIGANLAQYVLRVSVESGVPVDQIARDVVSADRSEGHVRTIVAVTDDPDSPSLGGNGGIFDFPGRYYLAIDARMHLRPHELRDERFDKRFHVLRTVGAIPETVDQVIVWADGPDLPAGMDPVLDALGPGWIRLSSKEHGVKDFWCWRRMFRCRRSVYERGEGETVTIPSVPPKVKSKKKGK